MSTVTAMSNAGNCVYCNQRVYENGEFKHVADRLVKEHHATCEKHPMRALEQINVNLKDQLVTALDKALSIAFDKSALEERVRGLEIVVKEQRNKLASIAVISGKTAPSDNGAMSHWDDALRYAAMGFMPSDQLDLPLGSPCE